MGLLPITKTISADTFSSECYMLENTEKIILTKRNEKSLITVIFKERVKGCMSKGTDI